MSKIKGQWNRLVSFFKEVRVELKKTTFPSRKETIDSTVIVLIITFAVVIFLGLVDFVLSQVVRAIMP